MATTKDGLPRRAFAYAPTPDPSTWKLPILQADGSVDAGRLPAAAAALSEGGHRGERADIPRDAMANVKSKLRQAYRRWKGSDVEYPDSIRESEDDLVDQPTFREATFLLDRAAVKANVVFSPDGDAFVVPEWQGAFNQPYLLDEDHQVSAEASWQVQDATRLLGDLYRLKANEAEEPADRALIDNAIGALAKFIKSEGDEIGGEAPVAEAGKRHRKDDESLLRSFHDLLKKLGVECEDPARETVTQAAVVEAAEVGAEVITFRESGFEMGLVTLREAAPKFDDDTQTVWITPIKPGWGNKRDKFFYKEAALKDATTDGLFNNIKMFKDHPRKSDEKELPERSVKDWFATTREAVWDEKRGVPRVPIKVHDKGDYDRFKDVPEQVAFSVLGGGLARPGKVNGEDGRIVESLKNVRSVDWVTEAGAGGAIDFAESAAQEHEDIKMEVETLSDEQIKSEIARRGWNLREAEASAEGEGSKATAEGDKAEASAGGEGATPAGGTVSDSEARKDDEKEQAESGTVPAAENTQTPPAEPAAEVKESDTPDVEAIVKKAVADALAEREKQEQVKESAKGVVASVLAESALPKRAKDIVLDDFREAGWGSGYIYSDEGALRGAVEGSIKKAAALLGMKEKTSKVTGMGDGDTAPSDVRESIATRIDTKFGPSGAPKEGNAEIAESGEAASVSGASTAVADRIGTKFGR